MKNKHNNSIKNSERSLSSIKATFLEQTINKEIESQQKFLEQSYQWKKPRNPILGELTSREYADNILEGHKPEPIDITKYQLDKYNHFTSPIHQLIITNEKNSDMININMLKQRRLNVESELNQINTIIKYKEQMIMNASSSVYLRRSM